MRIRTRFITGLTLAVAALALIPVPVSAQRNQRSALTLLPPSNQSAAISNVRYGITFDSTMARARRLHVTMDFDVAGNAPVLLSLPVWTPGAYEVTNFAKNVVGFTPTAGGRTLEWDKLDYDTWRVRPGSNRAVTVAFDFLADSLDNAMAWAKPDFLLVNGTNVFLYPEGRSLDYPATVTVTTNPDWQVATSMHPAGAPRTYREANYHDLVDMPLFIGRMDVDSMQISGKWTRFASYPAGTFGGASRDSLKQRISRVIPAEAAVLGETPWDTYGIMLIFDSTYGGSASALEHQASHVGVYGTVYLNPDAASVVTSVTAHEIFHAFNVKRLRPADMVPYRYSSSQPTPWLWVSEGITDYYATIALARAGVYDSAGFVNDIIGKMSGVAAAPPTALEDASLSTWIHPKDGTGYLYYPKGALAGFMLDIMIRDASDNAHSLDEVMRNVYQSTYKRGRGFTGTDWWGAVSKAAGGRSFDDFNMRYVDGREVYPWEKILPLAGLRYVTDTVQQARLGVNTAQDSTGIRVVAVVPGSVAAQAGIRADDYLVAIGGIQVHDPTWAVAFRQQFDGKVGMDLPITVRRGTQTVQLAGKSATVAVVNFRVEFDPTASAKAVRIRKGIIRGK